MKWLLFYLVCIILIAVIASFVAQRRIFCETRLTPDAALDYCNAKFSKLMWKRVAGEGDLNFRNRGPYSLAGRKPPTISISAESSPGGGSVLQIWMSSWSGRYGMVNGGPPIAWKIWSLPRGLRDAVPSAAAPKAVGDPFRPFPKESSKGTDAGDGGLPSPSGRDPATSPEAGSKPTSDPFRQHRESSS